jgi:hypothetical protein
VAPLGVGRAKPQTQTTLTRSVPIPLILRTTLPEVNKRRLKWHSTSGELSLRLVSTAAPEAERVQKSIVQAQYLTRTNPAILSFPSPKS